MENIKQRNELAPSSLTDEEVIAEAQRVIEHADAWHQDGNYRAQVKPEWVLQDAAKVMRDLLARLSRQKEEIALVRAAAADQSLSDGAARAVAAGLQEPTADDIAWARKVLNSRGQDS